ncbi:MAG: hypothetical protein K2K37_10970 [Muribaculaceae bacterium]|nr:hypothetical protein [Muribaculaceae bacterium]
MKKNILKIMMWTMALAVFAGFTSCSDDDTIDRNYGVNNDEVYFPNSLPKTIELAIDANSFDVELRRVRTADAITVPIQVTDESGLFSVPASVAFAEGADKAVLTIGYSLDDINYGDFKTVVLKIADESLISPYGASSYTFSAGLNEPWTSLGNCQYSDAFMFTNTYQAEIQQSDVDPTVFRVVNPYAQGLAAEGYPQNAGPSEFVQFRVLQPGEKVYDTTVTMENLVYFDTFRTGWFHDNYGAEVQCYWPGKFVSLSAEDNWTYNCVKSYQDNGVPAVVQLAPYYYMDGVGGWNYTQRDGMITIVFPGVQILDSSIEVAHTGFFHDAKDNVSVVADITLGDDVEEAKVALVQGSDGLAGANDIIGGIVESISVTSSGEVKLPIPEYALDGKYSVVAVSYIDGEPKEYDYATFTYTSGAKEQWTQIATGDYTYVNFFEGVDEGLPLYRSDSDPTRYKIGDWGFGVDFVFTMSGDGKIMVADQETGYVHSSYGMVYVNDIVASTGSTEYGDSFYDFNAEKFIFSVIYYVGAGKFEYIGPESFVITSEAQESARKAAARHNGKSLSSAVNITKQQLRQNAFPTKAIRQ